MKAPDPSPRATAVADERSERRKRSEYEFVVPGKPRAKGRPRMGRNGRVYTPKETHDAEAHVAACYLGPLFENNVNVSITLHEDSTHVVVIDTGTQHKSKVRADIDNAAKLVLDGLNGVAYADDSQVVGLVVHK